MGILVRKDFSGGWWPSADAINAPSNVLLRMDNCTLDEQGIVALRLGSSKVNSVALTDTDVHSLFSTLRSGSKVRYAGAGSKVYTGSTYGTDLGSTFAGTATDEIRFGAWLGQVFQARSTSKHKHDGTTQRTWGIAPPAGTPTVSAQTANTLEVASFDTGESPAFTATEGTITGTFPSGETGLANGALELTPASATGRGTIVKEFAADLDVGTIGGAAESPSDVFDIACRFTAPSDIIAVTVAFGIGDSEDFLREGSYQFKFQLGGTRQATNSLQAAMADAATQQVQKLAATAPIAPGQPAPSTANKRSREEVLERIAIPKDNVYREQRAMATADDGWTHLVCTRGQFTRIGTITSRGWTTVRAFQVTVEQAPGSSGVIRFDNAIMRGEAEEGMRLGSYKARMAFLYDSGGDYVERSGPSAESASINLYGQKLRVSLTAPGGNWNTLDAQINKVAVYIFGGVLDQYYEYSTLTAVPVGTGALDIDIGDTDVDLLIANNPLQLDNNVPPNNIIAIEGPHHNRLFVLTSGGEVQFSHRRRPGDFMGSHALEVGDGSETPYWLKRTNRGIYAGTSRDIYEISGDGAEQPDGTIDFKIEGLSVGSPPVDACVAAEGNTIIYRAADGLRLFDGGQSIPVPRSQVDLLWRGYTRHGVSPLNTTTGRFRAAVRAGVLTFIAPEGASTTSSDILHRADFTRSQWYRFDYPSAFRALFVEPDGVLLGADTSGFVRILDDKDASGADAGTGQSVVLWTKSDDNDQPNHKKDISDVYILLDTGSIECSLAQHVDGSASSSGTAIDPWSNGVGYYRYRTGLTAPPRRYQWRLTGTLTTFRLYEWTLTYKALPRSRVLARTGWIAPDGDKRWLREVRVMMTAGSAGSAYQLIVTNQAGAATTTNFTTSATAATVPKVYDVPMGREVVGSPLMLEVRSIAAEGANEFDMQVYWIEPKWDDSGAPIATEKKRRRYIPDQEEDFP